MQLASQPESNGRFGGPGPFADFLETDRIGAGVAAASDAEGEIGNAIRLLIVPPEESVSIVDKTMPLGPVRAGCFVLPALNGEFGASALDARPFFKVSGEMVLASRLLRSISTSPGPGQTGDGFHRHVLRQCLGRGRKGGQACSPRFFVITSILAGTGKSMFGPIVGFVVAEPIFFIALGNGLFAGSVGRGLQHLIDGQKTWFSP